MAYSESDWAIVKAFFEQGLSLSEITQRKEVIITDRSSISKKSKTEGWVKGRNSTLIDEEIKIKQLSAKVEKAKSTLNSTEINLLNVVVSEKTQDLEFYRQSSNFIANVAVEKVKIDGVKTSMNDLKAAQEVIGKGKENVYGKAPENVTQVNTYVGKDPHDIPADYLASIVKGN